MSVEMRPRGYWGTLDERQRGRDLATLFEAHTSSVFHRLVRGRVCGFDTLVSGSGDRAGRGESDEGSAPLPDTSCTSSHVEPTGEPSGDSQEEWSEARDILASGLGCDRERQALITELVTRGELSKARRLAECSRKSAEIECSTCGNKEYAPIHCDLNYLCDDCYRRDTGSDVARYTVLVEKMRNPTFLTLPMPNVEVDEIGEIEGLRARLVDAFSRFRRRVIPTSGTNGDRSWSWYPSDADTCWRNKIVQGPGGRARVSRLERKYVDKGRGIPVKELLRGGLPAVDAVVNRDGEKYDLNLHDHVIADMVFTPVAALGSVWGDCVDANVGIADVRRIDDAEDMVAELIGYALKGLSGDEMTTEERVEYAEAMADTRTVSPFGTCYGKVPNFSPAIVCPECDQIPMFGWSFNGVVDEAYDTIQVEDRPPPD